MAVVLFATLALACERGPKSAAGFRLPDGDVARGQASFVALKCNACHRVAGTDLPGPVAEPSVPVELGGRVARAKTDGELVTAIVDPSHRLAPGYPRAAVQSGSLSRMGDFSEAMTVRDLIDVVAFLQSRYEVVPPAVPIR
jgi:mono/diheme cytochrome c family protein